MDVLRLGDDPRPLPELGKGTALVVGNFDGMHRGHQSVVRQAALAAKGLALVPTLLTFDPHPAAVLGADAPPLLTTLERKAELAGRLGVACVVARTFDATFATWPPERFARELLYQALHARLVVVGGNFRFGAGRAGDFARLSDLGRAIGFEARAASVLSDEAGLISSTRARSAIAAGDMAEAARVLGRPHALSGVVVRGDARGRTLGFPTANLEGVPEMQPPNGVYAVAVDALDGAGRGGALGLGVMNLGVRPTVGGEAKRTIEAHLLDLDRDLYGARLRVHLVARLREEKRFPGLDALKAQIEKDVADARARLASVRPVEGAYG